MKKILLSLFTLCLIAWSKLNAQCTIAQSSIKISNSVSTPCIGGLTNTTFTLEFDIAGNGGNKFSYIHLWYANNAPSPAINWSLKPKPTLGLLQDGVDNTTATLLKTISLEYSGQNSDAVTVLSTFPADANVNGTVQSNVTVTKTGGHFKIDGIAISGLPCSPALPLSADVWSAQDANGKNVACGTAGLTFVPNDPAIKGFITCGTPRNFTVQTNTTINRSIAYTAYFDANNNGVIDATDTVPANIIETPGGTQYVNQIINAVGTADPTNFTAWGPNPYKATPAQAFYKIIIVAQASGVINRTLAILAPNPLIECSPLPVSFKSFNAIRANASNVSIAWTTASEQNNKGFNVQKNVNGEWKTIAFVFSQALNGNSTSDLSYSYSDPNNEKGISQYRVQQVDLDGKFTYSEIRAIRGEGAVGKIVIYPNPSADGKISVVFEDNTAVRDVIVNDMQGRIVQSFKGITNNILVIDRLTSGFYTIKVTNRTTAASSVQKVVIK
jgi:hypothetical protein